MNHIYLSHSFLYLNVGNKLVKEVMTPESDLLRKISNGLNRTVVGTGNWRNLAYKLDIPREDYEQFENPEGQEKPSPTIKIMEWVVGKRPTITIYDVVKVLKSIERKAVVEEIKNVVGKWTTQPRSKGLNFVNSTS